MRRARAQLRLRGCVRIPLPSPPPRYRFLAWDRSTRRCTTLANTWHPGIKRGIARRRRELRKPRRSKRNARPPRPRPPRSLSLYIYARSKTRHFASDGCEMRNAKRVSRWSDISVLDPLNGSNNGDRCETVLLKVTVSGPPEAFRFRCSRLRLRKGDR